jgi:protein-S-isoprenylcysteine O-methyltransferase Ste14
VPWLIAIGAGSRLGSGLQLIGAVALAIGLAGYGWCAADFVRFGRGTPAPLAPPRVLVVRGLYRYTRNPMYLSVLMAVLGQAILLASPWILAYAAALAVMFHLAVIGYEEPSLSRTFGAAYAAYRRQASRWLPLPRIR